MLSYLGAIALIFLLLLAGIGVDRLYRRFAVRHPHLGPWRSSDGACCCGGDDKAACVTSCVANHDANHDANRDANCDANCADDSMAAPAAADDDDDGASSIHTKQIRLLAR